MDRKAVARQIRDAIFDQAEADGRVMHGDKMDEIIEKVLALHDSAPLVARPSWLYADTKPTIVAWHLDYDFTDWSLANTGSITLTKKDGA